MAGSRKPLQISKWLPRTHLIVRIQPWEPSSPSPHTSRLATIITQKHCRGACVCPVQRNSRTEKTVSHNAVRRKNRLTEKTHASGKTKKCLSWHPSQWRMGRFGGTVESFLTASGGFLSLGRLEEVNSVIRWGPWRTCYIRASKLLTKLLPLGLLLIIHPHPDCKTMTKPNEDGRTVQHLCKRCTDVTHGMGADLSPSVHRSLVSPVQSDTQ